MARNFEMDPQATHSGLSSADAASASQPGASAGGVRVGGYASALMGAITGTQTMRQAKAEIRVAADITSREASVAAVQTAEAAHSGALST